MSKCCESIVPWIQNGPKMDFKKRVFSVFKISTPHMLSFEKKHEKMCLCSFFFGPFTRFFYFLKMSKIQKKRKNVPKIEFFLMLCTIFSNISVLRNMLIISHFVPQNKNLKKPEKKLLKLF